jgi:elongation factor G
VDSNEHAFRAAAIQAFREGAQKAKPVLLEPIMAVEVVTPEEYMGNVNGEINSRRGVILALEDAPSGKIIRAEVPLAEMFGYATTLRSATQGRATYSMEFTKYAQAPSNVAEVVMKKAS